MDGRQGRAARSLTFGLSIWISGVILVVSLLASIFSFAFAFQEANALQDGQLQEIGALVDSGRLSPASPDVTWTGSPSSDIKVVIQSFGTATDNAQATTSLLQVPSDISDGFHTLHWGGEAWRVYIRTLHTGRRIAIGQYAALRDEIARDGALRTLIPILCLVPVLIAVIVVLVRLKLAPTVRLSAILDRQTEANLEQLPEVRVPREIWPFVASINRLIQRLKESIEHQRRFIAHAAHELRSPLTALSLQAENLEYAEMSQDKLQRLAELRRGLTRARELIEQLLALAKLQAGAPLLQQAVSLSELVARVVGETLGQAEHKHIDLGSTRLDDVDVVAPPGALYIVLRNLADNAVRYTPEGGMVDIRAYVEAGKIILEVQDSGPGIPPSEIERVFTPFYRIPGSKGAGSGLGLAIVLETARRLGGEIRLDNQPDGLRATYSQPIGMPISFQN